MGFLRLYLALAVFNWHYFRIADDYVPNSYSAVFAFFIISGFYMSLVLNEKYANDASGTLSFYLGRALRLYPLYWIALVMLVALVSAHLMPTVGLVPGLQFGNHRWGFDRISDLGCQLLLFPEALWATVVGKGTAGGAALNWSHMYTVALEMLFYAVAPFIVRRKLAVVIAVAIGALVLHFVPAYLRLEPRSWQYEYFPSTLVFFMMGALSYRLYVATRRRQLPFATIGAVGLAVTIIWPWATGNGPAYEYTDAANPFIFYAIIVLTIPFLFVATMDSKVDRYLGDLSYPLYVFHPFAVLIIAGTAWKHSAAAPWIVGAATAFVVVAMVELVDHPMEKLRGRLARAAVLPRAVPSSA